MTFDNKTILITGASGFLGGWLARFFHDKKARVIGLDHKSTDNTIKLHGLSSEVLSIENCDIRNFYQIKNIIEKYPVDFIFHTAAIAHPKIMLENPLYGFEVNIQGTWNILEIARNVDIKGILIFSSERVYEANTPPFKETDTKRSLSLYGASKASAEGIASAYAHTFGLPVVNAVCANIYGGADPNLNRLVPYTIISLLNNQDVLLEGTGYIKKDFLYIKDFLDASEIIISNAKDPNIKGNSFNIGTGDAISTFELVNMISKYIPSRGKIIIKGEKQSDPLEEYLSNELIKKTLNWSPSYSIERGLMETIEWYKYFLNCN